MPLDYKPLVNDLRVAVEHDGGFTFVYLYDADDYDRYVLGEDEIKALHAFLGEIILRQHLC